VGKLIRFRRRRKGGTDGKDRPLFPSAVPGDDVLRRAGTDARSTTFPSDAVVSEPPPRSEKARHPDVERRRKRRRNGAIAAFAAIFCLGVLAAVFGDRGYLDVRRQRERLREMQAQVDLDEAQVQMLKRKIDALKTDPTTIERIAREELGYAAPGEIVLLLPEETPTTKSNLDAKSGSAIVP
jgi:cell division protein FtsB